MLVESLDKESNIYSNHSSNKAKTKNKKTKIHNPGIKIFIPDNGAKKCCHLSHTWGLGVAEIFKLLGVSLGEHPESSTIT